MCYYYSVRATCVIIIVCGLHLPAVIFGAFIVIRDQHLNVRDVIKFCKSENEITKTGLKNR